MNEALLYTQSIHNSYNAFLSYIRGLQLLDVVHEVVDQQTLLRHRHLPWHMIVLLERTPQTFVCMATYTHLVPNDNC